MTRYVATMRSEGDRRRVQKYVAAAPLGTRVEIKAIKRSLPQNDKFWAMLSDVAAQKEHNGRKYTPEIWKTLFMQGWKHEVQFLPSLDGQTMIPIGQRSSDLSKQEMSDLIEFIAAWGAENGVVFHDVEIGFAT